MANSGINCVAITERSDTLVKTKGDELALYAISHAGDNGPHLLIVGAGVSVAVLVKGLNCIRDGNSTLGVVL